MRRAIEIRVTASDKDDHMCQGVVTGKVSNFILPSGAISVQITGAGIADLVNLVSTQAVDVVERIWTGSWTVPPAAVAQMLDFQFSGTVSDKYCAAHPASKDTDVSLDGYKGQFAVVKVDLDVDSENHWGNDYFTTAFRTEAADAIEDKIGEDKSKVVFVNDIDKDSDGVPDFMDGWNCPLSQIAALEREISGKRGANIAERFVPMILELAIPSSLASAVRVKFIYPESKPSTMALKTDIWSVTQHGETRNETAQWIASDEGRIRIWEKDGSQARTVDYDYVESDTTYTLSDLDMTLGAPKTFYVEGINASDTWSDVEITAMVSTDGGSTWICEDVVRITCLRCNFTVEVVTQYYRTEFWGRRTRFTPDYTSPSIRLNGVWDAQKEDGTYHKLAGTSEYKDMDWWWHEPDAVLGHGFASFQYEGPDLGTDLSTACAGSGYKHKYFWGKTGGGAFTFWDYNPFGHENSQSDLAWWDVCEYQLRGGGRLVFRRTYTLHYDRMSDLFGTFNDLPSRYDNFGLHINPANKGWGCLSNIGLAMEDHGIDDARMANCRVTKNMPTTANKSVWRVVMGTYYRFGFGDEFEAVFDAVKNHCSGVAWGASVPNSGTGNLGGDLLAILQGESLIDESGSPPAWDIINESSLGLNMNTDTLDYFDPGLVPVEFGEHPEDIFDVQE